MLTAAERRAYLDRFSFGELIWLLLLLSVPVADPAAQRRQRRWRRTVNERLDALQQEQPVS